MQSQEAKKAAVLLKAALCPRLYGLDRKYNGRNHLPTLKILILRQVFLSHCIEIELGTTTYFKWQKVPKKKVDPMTFDYF